MGARQLPTWVANLVFERTFAQVRRYAALGWPMSLAPQPLDGAPGGCSCRRASCAEPGAHPWAAAGPRTDPAEPAREPTADAGRIAAELRDDVEANLLLRTGSAFDVLDLPASSIGAWSSGTTDAGATEPSAGRRSVGPVAAMGGRRLLFVRPGHRPYDRDLPGVRWHAEAGYVPAPPSVLPSGHTMVWSRPPELPLADPEAVLDAVAGLVGGSP